MHKKSSRNHFQPSPDMPPPTNKSRRLPASSYTGPRSEKFLNTCYERTPGTPLLSELSEEELALREKELDEQDECVVHKEMDDNEGYYDDDDGMSLGGALSATNHRGPVEDPKLDKFERWKMYERLHKLEWWLRYYSYDAETKICREVRASKNRIAMGYRTPRRRER